MPKRIVPEFGGEARRPASKGYGLRGIGRLVGCSRHAFSNVLVRDRRRPEAAVWKPSPARLSLSGREENRALGSAK